MTKAKTKAQWERRFVGDDVVPAADLVANPQNFRRHPRAQRKAMTAALDTVGWIQRVIVNRTTGHIVDGHLRVEEAAARGEDVPVVYVELSEDEERAALLTFDPLGALAQQDNTILDELLADHRSLDLDVGQAALIDQLYARPEDESDEPYTQKIEIPIYEPTGPRPAIKDLFDTSTTLELIAEIEAADIPKDLRTFLLAAAQRHTVLRFDRIANYYAHATPAVQALMEASALVIIDAEQAIERGFLKLHEDVLDAFHEDYPDA